MRPQIHLFASALLAVLLIACTSGSMPNNLPTSRTSPSPSVPVNNPSLSRATPTNTWPPCSVTIPNGSTPPGERPSSLHHGNGDLWTVLWPEGRVVFEPGGPGFVSADGSLSMKWPWWRGGRGRLSIDGRRLDASAPPLRSKIPKGYGGTGFQATALIFPTEGCWEVTGKVGQATLTFVTLVVRVKERK